MPPYPVPPKRVVYCAACICFPCFCTHVLAEKCRRTPPLSPLPWTEIKAPGREEIKWDVDSNAKASESIVTKKSTSCREEDMNCAKEMAIDVKETSGVHEEKKSDIVKVGDLVREGYDRASYAYRSDTFPFVGYYDPKQEKDPEYVKYHEKVTEFIESVPLKSRVLDLGCGCGVPIAKECVERGLRVEGRRHFARAD